MTSSHDVTIMSHDVYQKVSNTCKNSLFNYLPFKSFWEKCLSWGGGCTHPKLFKGLINTSISFAHALPQHRKDTKEHDK